MAHPILNRICPIVLVTGCHTRNTKLADFLLPAFCTQSHLRSGLPGPSNLVAKSTRVWSVLPAYDNCLWGKRRKCSHPSRLRGWSSLALLLLFEMLVGGGGRTKVECVSGEGRGIAKKKKASCTQKGMGPSKAKKCHPNCASERRKWDGFLIYGYARGSLGSPRFIASCDESLCACEARTHRGPRFFMNCKYQFMCAHHVPVLSHFNVQCPGHFRRVWLKTGRIIPEARVHFYCTTLSGAGGCPKWTMHVSGVLLQGCQWGKQCVILKKAVDGAVTQEK